jgi:hypothetical protein
LVRYPPKRPDLPLEVKEGQSPLPAPRWVPRIAITEVNGLELGVVAGLVVRDSVSNVPGVAVEHRGRSRQAIPEPLNELAYRPAYAVGGCAAGTVPEPSHTGQTACVPGVAQRRPSLQLAHSPS